MSQSLHEKASNILAMVMELEKEEAVKVIHEQCQDDQELLQEVISLYQEFTTYTPQKKESSHQSHIQPNKEDQTTSLYGKISNHLLKNKNSRLIVILCGLVILLVVGFWVRKSIYYGVFNQEIEEKTAQINATSTIINDWVENEKRKVKEIATTKILKDFAIEIDSLQRLEIPDNEYLEKIKPYNITINKLKEIMGFDFICLLHKNELKITYNTWNSSTNELSPLINKYLSKKVFDYHNELKKGNTIFIPPIHVTESLLEEDSVINRDSDCATGTPIYNYKNEIVGYVLTVTLAKNQFSNLFKSTVYGQSSEAYALNQEGFIISESRFTKVLQEKGFLNYGSSIYHLQGLNPGVNVMEGEIPEIEVINWPLTATSLKFYEYYNGIIQQNSGSIHHIYKDYRGVDVIGVWKWLDDLGFGIVLKEDAADALVMIQKMDWVLGVLYFIICLLCFLLYHSNIRILRFNSKIKKLGQFAIVEKIGEGGFGVVYKAEHALIKMPVAIKLLKKEFNTDDNIKRFEREVRATSTLKHPNTIKIYDYGISNEGNFYYVMEFIEGITLGKIIDRDEQFPINRAVYILLEVAYSLREAHHKNLVHRDIKPMNILLSKQGEAYDQVKLLDFGLVKELTPDSEQTAFHKVGGTPLYMAPERLRDPKNSDSKVDIYSLGILGFYMLNGRLMIEILSQKVLSGQEIIEAREIQKLIDREDIPEDLYSLLVQCIQFNPEKRIQNIDTLIQHLEKIAAQTPWNKKQAYDWWKTYDIYIS
ncbi:serine/threonine-protein kinase [Flammeovirga sp. EKP202]|uniref:serine/threonine-protein kinase n=1 Tax=Flammeovirga sp. EKP202 TaxID=2770592 RepID=UPI00165F3107|nr:serine/threonine-protein kinase [Flammeovirga sp. EKP202]MBD0400737.1 serine/threonine protein kinase [Flammeovirga sp. EKP202]